MTTTISEPSKNHLAALLVDVLRRLRAAHERIRDLESDLAIYREMAIAGIHALHDVIAEREAARRSIRRLCDERRHAQHDDRAA